MSDSVTNKQIDCAGGPDGPQTLSASVTGRDHRRAGKVREDADRCYEDPEGSFAIAAVADGHGASRYARSERGAELAVGAAVDVLTAFMNEEDAGDKLEAAPQDWIRELGSDILQAWHQRVLADFEQDPMPLEEPEAKEAEPASESGPETNLQVPGPEADRPEIKIEGTNKAEPEPAAESETESGKDRSGAIYILYGTTLLAVVMSERACFGLLIGDGTIALTDEDGQVTIPVEDGRSVAQYTSSLCERDALAHMETFYQEERPLSAVLSSDGLVKSFPSRDELLRYHVALSAMMTDPQRCRETMQRDIERRTEHGSGDDITIAAIFRHDRILACRDTLKRRFMEMGHNNVLQ